MDEKISNIEKQIGEMNAKIDKVYISSEKMRKYFLWALISTVVVVIVPLLLLPFVLQPFLNNLNTALSF